MITADDIIAVLPDISYVERKRIRTLLDWLPGKSDHSRTVQESLLWQQLVVVAQVKHLPLPGHVVDGYWPPRIPGFKIKRWELAYEAAKAFEEDHAKGLAQKQRVALYRILIGAACDYVTAGRDVGDAKALRAAVSAVQEYCPLAEYASLESAAQNAARALSDYRPLSVPRIIEALTDIESVVEHAFPGYLRSGILLSMALHEREQ